MHAKRYYLHFVLQRVSWNIKIKQQIIKHYGSMDFRYIDQLIWYRIWFGSIQLDEFPVIMCIYLYTTSVVQTAEMKFVHVIAFICGNIKLNSYRFRLFCGEIRTNDDLSMDLPLQRLNFSKHRHPSTHLFI